MMRLPVSGDLQIHSEESVRTNLGRIVTVMWLLMMIIFNSSYTASLASLLSAQQRYPTIESFDALRNDPNIQGLASAGAFDQAFRKGPQSPGGIGAALDELPYVQILVGSKCDLTIASTTDDRLPTFGGFGFAFRKGDPLID
ncbi:hypothetical protein KP509_23G025200 [Ceratopteris richardii]|uniref:Ionotropic glutamate receptor C-terminal domain-containing protein n=1 Tax=Ceratopteris richardii TaxID=49495 RepID=A0A8T2RYL7_CERRI|nr:hypothetical protein KP509_23G025200 [Ceratopteris richardii]